MTDRVLEMLRRMRSFFRDEKLNHDLDEEIAAHLELAIEENLQRGMTPDEARCQALIRFGGAGQAKERHRDARGLPVLDVLLQDLRYALRTFRRNPGLTIVAILILALGIGANVSVFSVVHTIMLRPLPFPGSQPLAWLASDRRVGALSLVNSTVEVYE